jgi:hypothetical protein
MKPVTFSNIEYDFHNSPTIKIEFNKIKLNAIAQSFNGWLLYVYHTLCAVLALSLIFALVNISTINPNRFYVLLGVSVVAFGVGSLLWVGRR